MTSQQEKIERIRQVFRIEREIAEEDGSVTLHYPAADSAGLPVKVVTNISREGDRRSEIRR